ncbi:MAG: tRNA uridine-5-carboxymethylaminomethyl(34) synthesis GTPase MnmE [Acidobacteria bacterium]|nr:tRNA uridine-5-carboxymethylaminomethyl(34) synthesis GTPase MnmE [Acidobacteriota bacterium]
MHTPDDPIAALATSAAPSALAVIRVSGPGSLPMLSRLLRGGPGLDGLPGHTIHLRTVRDGDEDIDQVMVAVYRAPRSYTGEDGAELFCHGSMPVIQRVLALLSREGFRPAGPGEFTQRAFLNGRMDLTRAEAVNEIVRARTDRARGLALQRLSGAIEGQITAARELLVGIRAALEVGIDYPDEEDGSAPFEAHGLEEATAILEGLVRTYRRGRIYQEGITAAIAGATNSGKSSLFNLLLRQERAIVSDIHGTTRDYLEGMVSVEGIPVRIFDTAGMRQSADPLEVEGMRRTEEVVRAADLVVYLVDSQLGVEARDEAFLAGFGSPVIRVWNKIDLTAGAAAGAPALAPPGFIPLSAVTGTGVDDLEGAIAAAALAGTSGEAGEPLIDSERQRDCIGRALESLARFRGDCQKGTAPELLAVDLAEALGALGEITGEVTSAEILDRMFSSFCVGK